MNRPLDDYLLCARCEGMAIVLRCVGDPGGSRDPFVPLCWRHAAKRLPDDVELIYPEALCACGRPAAALALHRSGRWTAVCDPYGGSERPSRVVWLPVRLVVQARDVATSMVDTIYAIAAGRPVVAIRGECRLCAETCLVVADIGLCMRCCGIFREASPIG